MTERPRSRAERKRRLGHDVAGEAYATDGGESPASGAPRGAGTPVSSRSTEAEARDIVAIRRAKRGDTGAFAELLRSNDDAVRALVWALTGPDQLDELCAKVYLRAFRGLPLAPTTAPRTWLLGIADGTARDLIRRWDRHPGTSAGAPPIPLELPAETRLVLAATGAAGLTLREAARLVEGGMDHASALADPDPADPAVALEPSDVPDHHPGFWDNLGRRLLIEQSQPAATASHRADTGSGTPSDSFPSASGTDAARGMAFRIEQQHPRSFPWRKVGLVVAVLVSVVVLVGAAVSIAHRATTRDAGLGETAAKTLDELDAALAGDTVVRGVVAFDAPGTDLISDDTVEFVRTNTGSWRNTARDGSFAEGYDVDTSVFTTVRDDGDGDHATVRGGIAPGPPSPTASADDALGDLLADAIRIVRSGSGGSVVTRTVPTTTTETGGPEVVERTVWDVTSSLDPDRPSAPLAGVGILDRIPADEVVLTADRSLALPTRLVLRRDGRTLVTVEFSELAISQQHERFPLAPEAPATARVTRTDDGFEAMALGALTSREETTPTPSYLPAGYVLTATAVDPGTHTVVVCYRNGSRQLVLTGRPAGAASDDGPGTDGSDTKTVDVGSGMFSGRTARVETVPIGMLTVTDSHTEVVVTGDPPVEELEKVIASLR